MKRLSTGILAAIVVAGFGMTSALAQTPATEGNIGNSPSATTVAQASALPPADFGAPPSGEVPILFNDHHVYSKPDRLKQNRVLSALVRGNTILVPLRSMFEQMGATVSYDPASKTVDVSKPGSDVKVTVGKPEVVINGESRPLDVPPEIYKGTIVVPVRVISEGMGAYVQWVPERHVVVVRYVSAPVPTPEPTAPPTPEPTMAPTPPPTPAPTATPKPAPTVNYEKFIVGDYVFSPKVYNEFSPGNTGKGSSFAARGAVEFPLFGLPWMLEGDYRSISYPYNGQPVTVIGGYSQVSSPTFTARDTDFDGRFGLKIADPRIYIGVGYLYRYENYGYPKQTGFGFGLEKLPDLDQTFSLYGSVYYYPSISGNFTFPTDAYTTATNIAGTTQKFEQRYLKFQVGGTYTFAKNQPLFLDFGVLGDTVKGKNLSPSDGSTFGPYVGLGIKF
jgi:hypothetical protein